MPFTFKDCYDIALARGGEDVTNPDPQALTVIKSGVNSGYIVLASTVAKTTTDKVYTLTPNQKKFVLPNDLLEIVLVEHSQRKELFPLEYQKVGDLLFLNTSDIKNGTLTVTYVKLPSELKNDSDSLSLADSYKFILAAYATYTYFLAKKKYSAAQMLTSEFNAYISVGSTTQNTDDTDLEDYTVKNTVKRGR